MWPRFAFPLQGLGGGLCRDWAGTQNNLGNALAVLGERESGTERLEQAVVAFTEALKEQTREQVLLASAETQNNLGFVIQILRDRGRVF